MMRTDEEIDVPVWNMDAMDDDAETVITPYVQHERHSTPEQYAPPVQPWPEWQPDTPEEDDEFSLEPFSKVRRPASNYLDPDGGPLLSGLYTPRHSPRWQLYDKQAPNSLKAARRLYYSLASYDIYGKQTGPKKWQRCTAGCESPGGKFTQSSLPLSMILSGIGSPLRYATANSDERVERSYESSPTLVRQLRIDVDMEHAWYDEDLEELTRELRLESDICRALGLTPHFFSTGGRGHQIVIPTPYLDRSVAGLMLLMLRYLLVKRNMPGVVFDRTNLDSLMRLPLGRHADTHNVAWMLDSATGLRVPLGRQVQAVEDAFVYQDCGCDVLSEHAEGMSRDLQRIGRRTDAHVLEGVKSKDKARFAALEAILGTVADSPLIEKFHSACDVLRVKRLAKGVSISVPIRLAEPQVINSSEEDKSSVSGIECTSHDSEEPCLVKRGRKVGKGWAAGIIGTGFEPGDFHRWSRSDGDNGIGAAIILADGDKEKAEEILLGMAASVDGSREDKEARVNWIKWAVPRNNIDVYYRSAVSLDDHRSIDGHVLPFETERAQATVTALAQRRMASAMRKKVFPPKALLTIQHIVELAQVQARLSPADAFSVSERTLLEGIRERWPEDATSLIDLQRQLKYVVVGQACLFSVLMPLWKASAFSAWSYALGDDFLHLLTT